MSKTEHTPTPWQVVEVRTQCGRAFRIGAGEMLVAGKGCCIIYDDYPGRPDNERAANAEFIVRAVNSHDEMLAALKWAEAALVPFSKEPAEKSGINLIRTAISRATGQAGEG